VTELTFHAFDLGRDVEGSVATIFIAKETRIEL